MDSQASKPLVHLHTTRMRLGTSAQPSSTPPQSQSTTLSQVELLVSEISLLNPELDLVGKHGHNISTLANTLNQLLLSRPEKRLASVNSPTPSTNPDTGSFSSRTGISPQSRSITGPSASFSPYMMYPPGQIRMFTEPNMSHLNYPVIPRWRDRARLRKIQAESPSVLPADLPPWSVRSKVPTVPQPDWSEEGGFLLYDGFSIELMSAYSTALEADKVPQIPIPYEDEEMKRALVEAGVLSEQAADKLVEKNGRESWRGPTEGKEDEKHREEMRKIIEGDPEV
ncbi:hypothetical protein P154DRAFT_619661 [Amniculicola lignicola CBS 123094]|uniref:Uncharacterized protein n=1 Tax=Amniculicola lignicola CBS 123094 TaxID=1392246 RepID=A0A6A5WGT8_9PLEO|nr:hypothetical protein P154DRAFT_619661 [Amniculicola lignicola CBS 123094]